MIKAPIVGFMVYLPILHMFGVQVAFGKPGAVSGLSVGFTTELGPSALQAFTHRPQSSSFWDYLVLGFCCVFVFRVLIFSAC